MKKIKDFLKKVLEIWKKLDFGYENGEASVVFNDCMVALLFPKIESSHFSLGYTHVPIEVDLITWCGVNTVDSFMFSISLLGLGIEVKVNKNQEE